MAKSSVSGLTSLILVLVAFSSLVSMFAVTRIDSIVHGDLYRYNLRFSYDWAMPYWTMTTLVFAMGWFNIFIAIVFQFYVVLYGRKRAEAVPQQLVAEKEMVEEPIPHEMKQAETVKAEQEEATMPPMEVEVETRGEGEEAQQPVEEPEIMVEERSEESETLYEAPQEETQEPVEGITPQEYMETEQPEEAEGQRESETEPMIAVEEEAGYTETVETEPEEQSTPWMETTEEEEPVEAESGEEEKTQTETWESTEEHETLAEETRQKESEVSEQYSN